jgi:integrase
LFFVNRKQKWVSAKGCKKDAEAKLAEILRGLEMGWVEQSGRLTLGGYLVNWYRSQAQLKYTPRTAEGYRFILERYIVPRIGHVAINKLQPQHVQDYLSDLLRHGRLDGNSGLSRRSVLNHYRLLHKALNDAVRQGLLIRNVCDAVDPPRPVAQEMSILAPDNIEKFLSASKDIPFPYYYLFRTMLFTGLRRSEAIGLSWDNLDLELCTLRVTQTLHKLTGGIYKIMPPKTRHGRRQVDLSPSLALLLREYKAVVKEQRALLGEVLSVDDFVFTHSDGSPLDPSTVTHMFAKVIRKIGLGHIRLHDLRHTYTSIMIAAVVNIKAISQSLGHSNIGITLDTYGHLLPGVGKSAAERFSKLLKPWLADSKDVGKWRRIRYAPRGIRTHDPRFRSFLPGVSTSTVGYR